MSKKNTKKNKKADKPNIKTIISVISIAAAALTVIYYMLGPSEGYLHSDCVDTMTWAQATIDSGKLFSTTFCYPYLLPFGATFLVYPFMLFFGFTMFAYRFAMLVFMLLFGLGIYFTARGLGWSRNSGLIAAAFELITVSSSGKLRELFWEHIIHYSLGAFLAFVLLALTFAFIKHFKANNYSFNNNRKAVVLMLCMALWSFFSAFDGLTTLTLSSIPVMGSLLLVSVFDLKNKIISKANKDTAVSALIIFVAAALGGIFLSIAAKDIGAGYGSAYSNIVDKSEWSGNLMKFLEQWTSLLGADYEFGGSITKARNVFAAVKMAGSLVLFFVPVYAVFIFGRFNRNERIFIIFHWLMTGFILYGYVFGSLSSVNWRLSPIICSAIIVNIIVWKYLWSRVDLKRGAVLVSSLVVLSCVVTVCQIWAMPGDYGRDNDHHKAIELLERNGLDYGYATYWNANILTLLSSSKVKVRDVNIDESYPRTGWLNSDNLWFEDQPGQDKYFFLLTNSEYEDAVDRDHVILEDAIQVIREGNWVVIVKDRNIF
ncbi:MAG: hypothetical protein Q4D26_04765 [Clostridia bacterium]|nr:hypothetical protein [Clostridia bacterium]